MIKKTQTNTAQNREIVGQTGMQKKQTIRQADTQNGKQKPTLTKVENSIQVIMKLQLRLNLK